MECLKSGLGIFVKRRIQATIGNSHTVTNKPTSPAEISVQLEFNCSGHNEYHTDLNSVLLLLRLKLVKADGSDPNNAESNTFVCINNFYIPCLVLLKSR